MENQDDRQERDGISPEAGIAGSVAVAALIAWLFHEDNKAREREVQRIADSGGASWTEYNPSAATVVYFLAFAGFLILNASLFDWQHIVDGSWLHYLLAGGLFIGAVCQAFGAAYLFCGDDEDILNTPFGWIVAVPVVGALVGIALFAPDGSNWWRLLPLVLMALAPYGLLCLYEDDGGIFDGIPVQKHIRPSAAYLSATRKREQPRAQSIGLKTTRPTRALPSPTVTIPAASARPAPTPTPTVAPSTSGIQAPPFGG